MTVTVTENSSGQLSASKTLSKAGQPAEKVLFTNRYDGGGETVNIRATKQWAGSGTHPQSVTVRLYRNGTAHGELVTLNAANSWDFQPGMSFTVKLNIYDIYSGVGRQSGQNYIDFVCKNSLGYGYVFQGVGYYNRELMGTYQGAIPDKSYPCGSIIMYSGINKRYTANQYTKTAAHELGHVLGLGDLYGKGVAATKECPGGTKFETGDIMGAHGHVTANNIEMFLEAYRTNRYQAYVNSGLPEVKSAVIRSY